MELLLQRNQDAINADDPSLLTPYGSARTNNGGLVNVDSLTLCGNVQRLELKDESRVNQKGDSLQKVQRSSFGSSTEHSLSNMATLLQVCVYKGAVRCTEWILSHKSFRHYMASLNSTDSPVLCAIKHNQTNILHTLLKQERYLLLVNPSSGIHSCIDAVPLYVASKALQLECVNILLYYGADPLHLVRAIGEDERHVGQWTVLELIIKEIFMRPTRDPNAIVDEILYNIFCAIPHLNGSPVTSTKERTIRFYSIKLSLQHILMYSKMTLGHDMNENSESYLLKMILDLPDIGKYIFDLTLQKDSCLRLLGFPTLLGYHNRLKDLKNLCKCSIRANYNKFCTNLANRSLWTVIENLPLPEELKIYVSCRVDK